jgi:hypothetical protein
MLFVSMLSVLIGCGDDGKGLFAGDPQQSYCEAVCDWASGCQAADRGANADDLYATCLTATEEVNDGCADAGEGLNPASGALLTQCTDAISDRISDNECTGFTGSYTEWVFEIPPAICIPEDVGTLDTYYTARGSTLEANNAMCDRMATTLCDLLGECTVGEAATGTVDQVLNDAGLDSITDYCVAMPGISSWLATCKSDGLYQPEDSVVPNITRGAAVDCLGSLSSTSCSGIFSAPPELPATCALAFGDTDDLGDITSSITGMLGDFIPSR